MARRKARTSARGGRRSSFVRRVRGRTKRGAINVGRMLAAGTYGFFRPDISRFVGRFTGSLPFGQFADEAGLLVAALITKATIGNRIPMLNRIANSALDIESAAIGEAIRLGGQLGIGNNGGPQLIRTVI